MKGIHEGDEVFFGSQEGVRAIFRAEESRKFLEFPPEFSVPEFMKREGAAPLPPYIKRSEPRAEDRERYQTVFAEREGAIAAPTASLHFTPRILSELQNRGVEILYVTLHVGIGTFQPVTAERVEDHQMQTEFYEISPEVAESIRRAKEEGRTVTAVGTTAVRAVESYFSLQNPPNPPFSKGGIDRELDPTLKKGGELDSSVEKDRGGFLSTNLFIHPGYPFKVIDRLLTNFHQPESTPLFLTCAFAGKDFVFQAYREAIEKKYRLFSYGDCMFVL
jgi:S-adenosylmethionine:tRNA ribosyltransferase-isomerase